MKLCITCGTENENDAHRCRRCNGAFFSNIVEIRGADSQRQLVCSGCGRFISAVGYVCPNCNYSIAQTIADARIARHIKLKHASGTEILVGNGDILGRDFCGRDFFRKDAYVSASHIKACQAGKFYSFEDISSGNSFFVNMRPIPVKETAIVKNGDVIKIGVNDFVVEIVP